MSEQTSNVVRFKAKTDYIPFYEVLDSQRVVVWGGGSPSEALDFWRNSPSAFYLVVSNWVEEGEDARMIGETIDITEIIRATIENCADRWIK